MQNSYKAVIYIFFWPINITAGRRMNKRMHVCTDGISETPLFKSDVVRAFC